MVFDPDFYRSHYADAAPIADDERLFRHYLQHARQRHPNSASLVGALEAEHGALPMDFDAAGYLARFSDLRAAFRQPWQGQVHFLRHGRAEGRSYPSLLTDRGSVAHQGLGRISLVLEGIEASGKSTLADSVAAALGGCVVRPFAGTLGVMLQRLVRSDQGTLADRLAREAVVMGIEAAPAGVPLVFDQHWITVCHILPEAYHAAWLTRPDTVLCWADLPTTQARLRIRGGGEAAAATVTQQRIDHIRTYALERGLPLLDTSHLTPAQATAQLVGMLAEEGVRNV